MAAGAAREWLPDMCSRKNVGGIRVAHHPQVEWGNQGGPYRIEVASDLLWQPAVAQLGAHIVRDVPFGRIYLTHTRLHAATRCVGGGAHWARRRHGRGLRSSEEGTASRATRPPTLPAHVRFGAALHSSFTQARHACARPRGLPAAVVWTPSLPGRGPPS